MHVYAQESARGCANARGTESILRGQSNQKHETVLSSQKVTYQIKKVKRQVASKTTKTLGRSGGQRLTKPRASEEDDWSDRNRTRSCSSPEPWDPHPGAAEGCGEDQLLPIRHSIPTSSWFRDGGCRRWPWIFLRINILNGPGQQTRQGA